MSLTFASGQKLTAASLNALVPVEVVKVADTSRTSTITRTADPHLTLTMTAANSTYELTGWLWAMSAANAAGDIAYEVAAVGATSITVGGAGPHNSLASGSQSDLESVGYALSTSPAGPLPYGTSTTGAGAIINARIVTGASPGAVTINWAQLASNASSTTLKAGSWIRLRQVA